MRRSQLLYCFCHFDSTWKWYLWFVHPSSPCPIPPQRGPEYRLAVHKKIGWRLWHRVVDEILERRSDTSYMLDGSFRRRFCHALAWESCTSHHGSADIRGVLERMWQTSAEPRQPKTRPSILSWNYWTLLDGQMVPNSSCYGRNRSKGYTLRNIDHTSVEWWEMSDDTNYSLPAQLDSRLESFTTHLILLPKPWKQGYNTLEDSFAATLATPV